MASLSLETLQRLFTYLGHHLLFDAAIACVCILIVSAITCMMSPDEEHDCFFHRQVY